MKKLEEQQDRWAVQRTRHEARIGELENALRDKKRYSYQNHWTNTPFPSTTNENHYLKFNYSNIYIRPQQTHVCRQNFHRSRSPFPYNYSRSQTNFKSTCNKHFSHIFNKDTVNIYDISYYHLNTPHVHSHIKYNNIETRHFRSRQHFSNNSTYNDNINTLEQEMGCGCASYYAKIDSLKYLNNTLKQRSAYKIIPSEISPFVRSHKKPLEKQYICFYHANKTKY